MSVSVLCPNHEWNESRDDAGQPVLLLTFALADVPALAARPRPAVALRMNDNEELSADFGDGVRVRFTPAIPIGVINALESIGKLWVCGLDEAGAVACEAELTYPKL